MIGSPEYPTYQVFLAILIAAAVTGFVMPAFIRLMKKDGLGQQVRADGPQSHLVKQGTPTTSARSASRPRRRWSAS